MISYLFSQPYLFLVWTIAFLIALSVHGTLLGDTTAKRMGRLTLNPASHVDPLGLMVLLFIGFGWGKPVPFNPYNLRWPKWGPTAVAAAGPGSNLLLAIVSALLLMVFGAQLGPDNLLTVFLLISLQLNIILMVFNLIPLPPLDGSKALLSILAHPKYAATRTLIETKGPMLLLLLILLDSLAGLGLLSRLFSSTMSLITWIIPLPPLL